MGHAWSGFRAQKELPQYLTPVLAAPGLAVLMILIIKEPKPTVPADSQGHGIWPDSDSHVY